MTVIAEILHFNHKVILDSYSDHDEKGYFSKLEIRVLVHAPSRWGWMWTCKRVVDCGRQYANGFDTPTPVKDSAISTFEILARELLNTRELDLSKIRNDE